MHRHRYAGAAQPTLWTLFLSVCSSGSPPGQDAPEMVAPALIALKEVEKRFEDARARRTTVALDGFFLNVAEGEFVCLPGPGGCGKSSVIDILIGRSETMEHLPRSIVGLRQTGYPIFRTPPIPS